MRNNVPDVWDVSKTFAKALFFLTILIPFGIALAALIVNLR